MFAPKYPIQYLTYYCLTSCSAPRQSAGAKGSSYYTITEGEIMAKKDIATSSPKKEKKSKPAQAQEAPEYREYKLNKSKVKQKIFAFYHLPHAYKYFRLWTLTFPKGTPDHTAYKILNNWLTRLRSELNLKDYVWIAERQQNSTIHFHLIFSQFINVQQANYFAAKSINNAIAKGEIWANLTEYKNYNGLDVSKKCGNWQTVAKYVTKYITKNNTTSSRLPYYCSQSISRLFTKLAFTEQEINAIIAKNSLKIKQEAIFCTEYYEVFAVEKCNIQEIFSPLIAINEYIYSLKKT